MIHKCAICGKEFDALWPDLYRYKRGGTFLCSWSCLRKYDNEKGSGNMARMKKDGTPAKKPGPRPKVELVYDESIAEEYKREQEEKARRAELNRQEIEKAMAEELKLKPGGNYRLSVEETPETKKHLWRTAAVRNEILGVFYYDEKHNSVDWRHPMGEEISLPPADWNLLAQSLGQIMHVLGVENQEMEV